MTPERNGPCLVSYLAYGENFEDESFNFHTAAIFYGKKKLR